MKLLGIIVLTTLISTHAFAFGGKRTTVALDPVTPSTLLDGDATGLVEGCGSQPSPLGVFCRVVEGEVIGKSVFFIGPPAQCDRAACVFIKVWNNQGQLVYGESIPKGQTRVEALWKTLLGRETAAVGDRGFWTFNTTVIYKDPDGRERQATSQGDIVLRVFRKDYVPLHNVSDDPAFVWTWTDKGSLYRMTAGLRAFVKKVN